MPTGITQDNFGPGVGPLVYQLHCNGTENRLVECLFGYSGSHYSDIGVKCLINISPGNIYPSIEKINKLDLTNGSIMWRKMVGTGRLYSYRL